MAVDPMAPVQNAPAPQPPQNAPAAPPDPYLSRVGYGNYEDWVKATISSANESTRLAQRVRELEGQQQQLAQTLTGRSGDPAQELDRLGIPLDALDAYLDRKVQAGVSARLDPMLKTSTAINRVKQTYPDFATHEPRFNAWLATNPDLNARLQDALTRDPDGAELAIRGAFALWEQQARAQAPAPEPPRVPTDARLPATQGNAAAARGTTVPQPTPEEIGRLLVRARAGDDRAKIALVKMRLGNQPHPEIPANP